MSMRSQGRRRGYLLFAALCIFTFVNLIPLLWAVLTSFK